MHLNARLLLLFAFSVFTSDASPLGDRALLARYNGVLDAGSRSFILRSQMTPPPACSAPTNPVAAKRAAQPTTASPSVTASGWSGLCAASGISDLSVNDLCFNLGQDGWGYALSAVADVCAQQNIADEMVSFAKIPGILNSDDIISYALSYRQLPREAVPVLGVVPSTLYCMIPPVNPELGGIVNAQPAGVSPGLFGSPSGPVVPFGSDGTCPYDSSPDVSTCSCIGSTANETSNAAPIPANVTDGTNTTTTESCDTCFTNSNTTATPDLGTSSVMSNATLTGSGSTLNGTDTTNSTLTGSDSTLNGTDATNSTLTDSSSTLNSTDSIISSASPATLTDSTSSSATTSTNTGISATITADVNGTTSSATATLYLSTDIIEASTTSTSSADASTGTSGATFDGNIHDPAGR